MPDDAPVLPAELSDHDVYLFREGTHARLHERLGCHVDRVRGGARFAVWAPNARAVSVVGDWNGWNGHADPLEPRADGSGIWEGRAPAAQPGQAYKYRIVARSGVHVPDKADPFAVRSEEPPRTASLVHSLEYAWGDQEWMSSRGERNRLDAAVSIYELHLGSWRRRDDGGFLGYREIAHALVPYVLEAGFTHVELLPVTEHPFYGSWGYQTTGYFAPTARYGAPEDFMYLVDHLHRHGIGVILDWVPSHFPTDGHGLAQFDGTHLYEHADPRQGFHPEWSSSIFNYGRHEVAAFLLSSAMSWLDRYHIDGLRVDAVASMLYLDYARKPGEWVPNVHGGHENLEAVAFLRLLNTLVYREHPDAMTIAEESTAWPMVSRPVHLGGLGFGLKWNMGWMHDSLAYMREDPVFRRYHQGRLTFSLWYAFNENFVLPLSHDEVVHGKGSLVNKMPGDAWRQLANLRALYGYMWAHPGKKLLFMGCEFGQRAEWAHDGELEWAALGDAGHAGLLRWVSDLNRMLREEPALHERDFSADGFEWVDCADADASVIAFLRKPARARAPLVLAVCNFTPVPRTGYRLGVPHAGRWEEILNSDAPVYGGSGWGNFGGVDAQARPAHGRPFSVDLTLPPLSVLLLRGRS